MVLHPGEVRRLAVVPSTQPRVDHRTRAHRVLEFTLDEPADPEERVVVTAALDTVLTENWSDYTRERRGLQRLEVSLPADKASTAHLEEITIEGPGARFAAAAAGIRTVDRAGVLHPAWYVHGERRVRIGVDVPEGHPELRWYDAGEGATSREVWLHAAGGRHPLGADAGHGEEWGHRTASLARWAGTRVEVELSATGQGVGLFGALRIVQPADRASVPNVVLYMIDTLRADHLGAWGSAVPGVSPNMDRLAAEGTQFGFAITSSPWTKPAIPTLLAGVWATTHRVGATTYADLVPTTVPLLQERFRDAGWRTGSFSSSPLGSTLSALERGFDTALPPGHWRGRLGPLGHVTAGQLHDALMDWAAEEPDQPFFAYVHTLEVHGWRREVYRQPPEAHSPYDFAVRDADDHLGGLLAALEAQGLLDDTLVVLLSDHGESFGDHGVKGHGTSLYHSQLHIPLLFWAPGDLPAMTVTDPVGIADVAPTLLDLFDLEPLPETDGHSLVPYFDGSAEPVHQWVPAARLRYVWQPADPQIFAMIDGDKQKLVREKAAEWPFDLAADPCEARTTGRISLTLRERLDEWLAAEAGAADAFHRAHGARTGAVDAADVEELKALGYLP
jgi:arylsulfatase A-like enzyme